MAESAPIDQLSLLAMELPEPVTLPEAPTKLETVMPMTAATSVTSIHIPRERVRISSLPNCCRSLPGPLLLAWWDLLP